MELYDFIRSVEVFLLFFRGIKFSCSYFWSLERKKDERDCVSDATEAGVEHNRKTSRTLLETLYLSPIKEVFCLQI